MRRKERLKKNIKLNSLLLIEFLKNEKLYFEDNGILNNATNVSALENANEDSLNWIKYNTFEIETLKSSILLVNKDFKSVSNIKSIIYTLDPKLAMVLIIKHFFLETDNSTHIDSSAKIDESVKIGKNCIINENVVIGENCVIGDNVSIHPNVILYHEIIVKDNVTIKASTVIGDEGFGYIKNLNGLEIQFPHLGTVILEKNVEIGANTCIARGVLSDTIIGENTKINDLCIISHNVTIGKNCLLVAKVGIAGSTKVEDGVYIGGDASIKDMINIGENAIIGGGSIIRKDVKANTTMIPFEAMEKRALIKALRKLRD